MKCSFCKYIFKMDESSMWCHNDWLGCSWHGCSECFSTHTNKCEFMVTVLKLLEIDMYDYMVDYYDSYESNGK